MYPMHCLSCGYNLHALPEPRCPECGRAFDPEDPTSWGNKRAYKFAPIARIAGLLCTVCVALPALFGTVGIAIGHYDAFFLSMLWFYATIPMMILLGVWLGSLKACAYKPGRRAYLVGIVFIALNFSLITEWPIRVAFYLHRPALNELIRQHQAGETITLPQQVGIFRVYEIETIDWWNTPEPIIDLKISTDTGNPDHLVFGMSDERYGRGATPFNIWSDRRLDEEWHIVHED